jgi:lipopolysaccharide export system protein LptA
MSERPAALGSGDEMAVRLESDAPGRVRFEDDGLAAVGHAAALEYALTTRLLVLEGTAEAPIVAAVAESGTLTAQSVTLGLGTGVGQATGAGRLEAAEPTRWISWQDQADVVFRVREGWMTGSLEQAIASGAVELHDGESWAKGQDLNARFADGGSSAPIERAVLTGDAQAAARRGEVQARRLDVRFAVDGDRSRPVLAVATGDVVGRQGDRTVRAGQLEADLAPEQDQDAGQAARSGAGDRVAVTTARARDGVRYDREDGSFGQGESMLVDAAGRTVRIEGSPGVVGGRGAVVESGLILLDDASDTIHTPGAGRLTVRPDDDQTQGAETVRAQWSGSMLYRDSTGELEVSGRVQIETPTPGGLDTIRAARVTAIIEPAAQASDEADGAAGGPASGVGRGRRLISAVALGEAEPASVEMQRDLPGAGPAGGAGRPARLTALLGARIEADNAAGVLTVPSAGRLLLSDSRAAAADEPDGGDLRGSALFDWEGSMVFDRPAGRAQMRRGVRMVHRPQDAESGVMELECEVLSGQFVEAEPLSEGEAGLLLGSGGAGELRSVEASGAVWARSGPRQMLSDRMVYDPATGGATATAEPGGWVTMFDQARSTPVTAGELLWSLQSGRIEVRRPSPVSVPR